MMKNLFHLFLSKYKIRKQIYIVFALTVILSVIITGGILTYQTVSALYERVYMQLESDNYRIKSILFDAGLNLYNISESLCNDKQLKQLLVSDDPGEISEKIPAYENDTLRWFLLNNVYVSSISIYSRNERIGEHPLISGVDGVEMEHFFSLVQTPGSTCWVSYPFNDKAGSPELALIRSIPIIQNDMPAIMILRMNNNFLKNRIQNNELFVSLSLDDGPIFFSSVRALQGTPETAPIDFDNPYYTFEGAITYGGERVFAHISSLVPFGSTNVIYINSLDYESTAYITRVVLLCMAIILFSITLPLIMITLFARSFSSRVNLLKNAMHDAKSGNYNIIDSVSGDDELYVTFMDLKALIENIKAQQAKLFESKITEQTLVNRQQQMQFKLLSSQINPHFVYNTLETIRMMALEHQAQDVSNAVKLLSKTMRYVLENTTTVSTTIDKELEYIESYMAIQKLRFGSKINYQAEIPENFDPSRYQILPILLQPIIENAVHHGLRDSKDNGHIHLKLSTQGRETLTIEITDNGKGMKKEQLLFLNEWTDRDEQNDSESIGLYNIRQRIKLFYGSEFGFTIHSERGTRIEMTLPLLPIVD